MGIILGLGVTVNDADAVRKALGIRGRTRTEKDQAVKAYVKTHVRGWPKQSNADERDACAVAIYGGRSK
jgi:Holliday junction resolvasome RuvABC endonuclease subunit